VDGKPRIVSQEYLGNTAEVMDRLSGAGPGRPERTQHKAFGDLAAVWGILDRLGVAGAIDEVCGSRRSDAGASVGTYLALATANRVVAPCSKLGFEQWWATTAGPRFTKVPVAATDHRRFWDAMDNLDTAKLATAEAKIAATMVSQFGLDLSGLALDMTNFATFIDSANEAAPIAKRGHAKQKRNDLRLVGLALVVTRDGAIPVTSHPNPATAPTSPSSEPSWTSSPPATPPCSTPTATPALTMAAVTRKVTPLLARRWCSTPARTVPTTSPTSPAPRCTTSGHCH